LREHTNSVYSIAQLSDGTIASGSVDRSIKLWNKDSTGFYKLTNTLWGHTLGVSSLTKLTSGQLASGSIDKRY